MGMFRKATPVYSVPKEQACYLKCPNASQHNSVLDTVTVVTVATGPTPYYSIFAIYIAEFACRLSKRCLVFGVVFSISTCFSPYYCRSIFIFTHILHSRSSRSSLNYLGKNWIKIKLKDAPNSYQIFLLKM